MAVIIWGLSSVLVKQTTLGALHLAFYRLWCGVGVMAVIAALSRRRPRWRSLLASAAGGALFGFNILLYFGGIKATSIADVTLISALQPGLVMVVAGRLFGERVTVRDLAWTAIAFFGIATFVAGSSSTPVWSLRGDVLAVGALFAWTAYFLVTKRVRSRVESVEYQMGVMVFASLVVTPVTLLSRQPFRPVAPRDWLLIAVIALVPGAGGHLLLTWAHRHVEARVSSLVLVGVPVVAATAAFVFLGEPVGPLQAVGGAIVVIAIGAVVASHRRAADESLPV